MTTSYKPMSLIGKTIITPTRKNLYHTKSYSSEVDETLFGTPTRITQQVETKRSSGDKEWDPPWATSPTRTGAPLLWTPFEHNGSSAGELHTDRSMTKKLHSKPHTPRSARTINKYRPRSHTPTYVDETLFGNKVKEASFPAPWEDKDDQHNSVHLLWSPQTKHHTLGTPRSDNSTERPTSRLGIYDDPYIPPTPRNNLTKNNLGTPVIRQRSGSSIHISGGSGTQLENGLIKLKLDFSPKKRLSKDEIVERALRLAKASQEAALNSARSDSARHVWKRPSSSTDRSPRTPLNQRKARLKDFVVDDHLLSASGIRVPLSARSETDSRPHSARLRPKSAHQLRTNQLEKRVSIPWRP